MCSGTLLGFGSLFYCPTGCNFVDQCASVCSIYVRCDASVQVVFFIVWPEHILLYNCSAMSTSSSSGASAAPKAKGKAKGRNQSPAMLALKMQKEAVAKNLKDLRSGMRKDLCLMSSVCAYVIFLTTILSDSIVNTAVSCLRTFGLP